MTETPAIVLRRAGHPDPSVLREIRAGAEEEGVPTRDEPGAVGAAPGHAVALAHAAALASALEVGIGVGADGAVAVHHASLPEPGPVARLGPGARPADLRIAGRTAARIVKCLPL